MNFLRRGGGTVAFGVMVACAGGAHAQIASPAGGGAPDGTERYGGSAHAMVTYDTNVAGGDDVIASLRQLRPEDYTYDAGASFYLQLPSSRQSLFFSGSGDIIRHQYNSSLDAENYSLATGGTEHFGACSGSLIASYNHQNALIDFLALAVTKNITETEAANLSATCSRRAFYVALSGGLSRITNDASGGAAGAIAGANFINSDTSSAAATVGYQTPVFGNLGLSATYSKATYPDAPKSALPENPANFLTGFDQYGLSLKYSRKIGLRLSGSASISYQSLQQPIGPNANTVGGDASLTYRATPRLNVTLSYDLSNQPSPLINANYIRNNSVSLGAKYTLNSRISVNINGSRNEQNYQGGIAETTFLQFRNTDSTVFSGGAEMRIGRKLSATLSVQHTDRRADVSAFNYEDDSVILGLTGKF